MYGYVIPLFPPWRAVNKMLHIFAEHVKARIVFVSQEQFYVQFLQYLMFWMTLSGDMESMGFPGTQVIYKCWMSLGPMDISNGLELFHRWPIHELYMNHLPKTKHSMRKMSGIQIHINYQSKSNFHNSSIVFPPPAKKKQNNTPQILGRWMSVSPLEATLVRSGQRRPTALQGLSSSPAICCGIRVDLDQ